MLTSWWRTIPGQKLLTKQPPPCWGCVALDSPCMRTVSQHGILAVGWYDVWVEHVKSSSRGNADVACVEHNLELDSSNVRHDLVTHTMYIICAH